MNHRRSRAGFLAQATDEPSNKRQCVNDSDDVVVVSHSLSIQQWCQQVEAELKCSCCHELPKVSFISPWKCGHMFCMFCVYKFTHHFYKLTDGVSSIQDIKSYTPTITQMITMSADARCPLCRNDDDNSDSIALCMLPFKTRVQYEAYWSVKDSVYSSEGNFVSMGNTNSLKTIMDCWLDDSYLAEFCFLCRLSLPNNLAQDHDKVCSFRFYCQYCPRTYTEPVTGPQPSLFNEDHCQSFSPSEYREHLELHQAISYAWSFSIMRLTSTPFSAEEAKTDSESFLLTLVGTMLMYKEQINYRLIDGGNRFSIGSSHLLKRMDKLVEVQAANEWFFGDIERSSILAADSTTYRWLLPVYQSIILYLSDFQVLISSKPVLLTTDRCYRRWEYRTPEPRMTVLSNPDEE